MRVKDFMGREHILNFDKHASSASQISSHHQKAIDIIKEFLPSAKIYNEVTLIGCKGVGGVVLRADIFLPQFSIVVEVHGKQHYEYNKFFHKSEAGFKQYCKNDKIKKEWCELNGIEYVELKYDEKEEWKELIKNAI